MEIKSYLTNRTGQVLEYIYCEDRDPEEDLEGKILQAVHGFCFCGDKLVIVYSNIKGYWSFPGGGIESAETYEEAIVREVKEETNMKVLHQELIGYQDVFELNRIIRQTRSFCVVEPYGEFVSDPDGDVTEVKLIEPKDLKQYIDWHEIGDRLLERALSMFKEYKNK